MRNFCLVLAFSLSWSAFGAATLKEETVIVKGVSRQYRWAAPDLKPDTKYPLIFAFHGGGGTAAGLDGVANLVEKALKAGFYIILPDGLRRRWNDGRPEIDAKTDDVGFIDSILARFSAEFPIDSSAVFSTGISNGGLFSFRLACERSDKFRAIAPVAMNMGDFLSTICRPKPVSVLLIQGDTDPLVPFSGGDITLPFLLMFARGKVLSSDDTLHYWAKLDGCTETIPAAEPLATSTGAIKTYHEVVTCPAPVRVERYVVKGGGHTWPGGSQYLPRRMVGALATDWSASDVILQFFRDLIPQRKVDSARPNSSAKKRR